MQLPLLNDVLLYKNTEVIKRFCKNYPSKMLDAENLFQDMLSYLWLTQKHEMEKRLQQNASELAFECAMHQEMLFVDEMWHTFILFTKDYTAFCQHYFCEYIHHAPNITQENLQTPEDFTTELGKYLAFANEHLGEKTVRRWFKEHFD